MTRKKLVLKKELSQLKFLLSEKSLVLLPEYECKLDVSYLIVKLFVITSILGIETF